MTLTPSKDSHQPWHPPCLIKYRHGSSLDLYLPYKSIETTLIRLECLVGVHATLNSQLNYMRLNNRFEEIICFPCKNLGSISIKI